MSQMNGDCVPMLRTLINNQKQGREGHPDYLPIEMKNKYRNELSNEIRSRIPNISNYDAWYLEYYDMPYMHHLTKDEFIVRWNDVFSNLTTITEDNKVSIGDPRKNRWIICFSHLLAESQFRGGVPKNTSESLIKQNNYSFLKSPKTNPAASIWKKPYIYKFGSKKWLKESYNNCEIRLMSASYYDDPSLNEAQKDKEMEFNFEISPQHLKGLSGLTGMSDIDQAIKKEGFNISIQHNSDFLIWCGSTQFDPRVHYGFGYDAVLIIKDKKRFKMSLEKSTHSIDGRWSIECGPVRYLDPMLDHDHQISVPFSKHFRFEYQSEYRVCISGPDIPKEIKLKVPKLHQFSEIIDIPSQSVK